MRAWILWRNLYYLFNCMKNKLKIREMIQTLLNESELFLRRMIDIPSPSGYEQDLADEISNSFNQCGFSVDKLPIRNNIKDDPLYCDVVEDIDYRDRFNLVINFQNNKSHFGGLVLNTHLDVVPASEIGRARYQSKKDGEVIYAR